MGASIFQQSARAARRSLFLTLGASVLLAMSLFGERLLFGENYTAASVRLQLNRADVALHRAKAEGGGAYRLFEQGMDAALRARRALEADLAQALSRGEFLLHYQPQAATKTGEIVGYEALLRWSHPERGSMSPAEFIPVAEDCNLILPLGRWVINEACQAAANWPVPHRIGVNLSPRQFQDAGLVSTIRSALAESGLAPERLELEVTEGVLIGDDVRALQVLREVKALGGPGGA